MSRARSLPAIGTAGETVTLSSSFDGWDYVHLIDNDSMSPTYLQSVDHFAIPEAGDARRYFDRVEVLIRLVLAET